MLLPAFFKPELRFVVFIFEAIDGQPFGNYSANMEPSIQNCNHCCATHGTIAFIVEAASGGAVAAS